MVLLHLFCQVTATQIKIGYPLTKSSSNELQYLYERASGWIFPEMPFHWHWAKSVDCPTDSKAVLNNIRKHITRAYTGQLINLNKTKSINQTNNHPIIDTSVRQPHGVEWKLISAWSSLTMILLLMHHCIIVWSPLYHCMIAIESLYDHYSIIVWSPLYDHHCINVWSPLYYCIITVVSFHDHHCIIVWSPLYYCMITIASLCYHPCIIVWSPLGILSRYPFIWALKLIWIGFRQRVPDLIWVAVIWLD